MLRVRPIILISLSCSLITGLLHGQEEAVQIQLDSVEYYKETAPWKARKLADGAVEATEGTTTELRVQTLYKSAGLYYIGGDKDKALSGYIAALRVAEKIKDEHMQAKCYSMIGELKATGFDKIEEGLSFHQKALDIYTKRNDQKGIAGVYNDIGLITGDLSYHYKSLAIDLEIGNNMGIADSYHNIASIYESKDQLDSAIYYFEKCLLIDEEHNGSWALSLTCHSLGRSLMADGDLTRAAEVLTRGAVEAEKGGYKEALSGIYLELATLEEKRDNYKSAVDYHKLHKHYADALLNEQRVNAVANTMAQYDSEKKDLLNEKLEKGKALSEERLKNERFTNQVLYIGMGLLFVIAIFIFNRFRITSKQKGIIEDQKQEVDQAYGQLEEKNKEILDSIQYAKRIQTAILPPDKLVKESLKDAFILYEPKDIVAGDFYWLDKVAEESSDQEATIYFAAADCTGHGVPGAMVSVVCHNALNRALREYALRDPGQILDKTREIVIQEFEKSEDDVKDGMDIALCALQGSRLRYAGANNPLWVIRKDAEAIEIIKPNKQPIGKYRVQHSFDSHEVQLEPGDTFYLFSDGFIDQFGGEKGKKFKASNFQQLLLSIQDKSMSDQHQLLQKAFENWKGSLEQLDDVCVIGVRF